MTIASTLTKKHYEGNGITKEFPLPFHLVDKTHVFAMIKNDKEIQEITKNFSVDLVKKTFTYPVSGEALPKGTRLTVYRKVPLTQIVDLENAGAFHPEVLEKDGFDRIVMQIQQLDEAIERTLKLNITDDRDVEGLLEALFFARDEAVKAANNAKQSEINAQKSYEKAKAWAESPITPDENLLQSKSSKTWALYAEEKAHELTELEVECQISNDGIGHVVYDKEHHKLIIILPFDNSGSNQPKVILTDEVTLNRSDIAASAKAIKTVNDFVKTVNTKAEDNKTKLEDKVSKTTTEVISGTKTFTAIPRIQDNRVDTTINPTANIYTPLTFFDKNTKPIGHVGVVREAKGINRIELVVRQKNLGTSSGKGINLFVKDDGEFWTYCPSPKTNQIGDYIATTKWVRDYGQAVKKIGERKTSGNWVLQNLIPYKPIFIICSMTGGTEISCPIQNTDFSDRNVSILLGAYNGTKNEGCTIIPKATTLSINITGTDNTLIAYQ